MSNEQAVELLSIARAILGELGRLNDSTDRLVAAASKRGGK